MYVIRQYDRKRDRPYVSRFDKLEDAKALAERIFRKYGYIVAIEQE